MPRIFFLFIVCLSISLSACSRSQSPKAVTSAKENSTAPDISVVALSTGKPLKLSDLKGKVVLLNFWATWCPPCREEIPSMMKLNSIMTDKPFQMIAVSIDEGGKQAIESFFKQTGFSLPTFLDEGGASSKVYGITGVPETFVINKQGIIVKKIVGGAAWDSPEVVTYLEGLIK